VKRADPRRKVCSLPYKSFFNKTYRSQGHVQKTSKCVCTSNVLVSPDPFSPTPSTASAMKTPEKTEVVLWWP